MKMKEFGPRGASLAPPLDPPMNKDVMFDDNYYNY